MSSPASMGRNTTPQIMHRLINYSVVIGSNDANSFELMPLTFEMGEIMARFVTKNYDMIVKSNYVRVEREIN